MWVCGGGKIALLLCMLSAETLPTAIPLAIRFDQLI